MTGCGSKMPLTGKVTYSDDNTPVTHGIVCFSDGKTMARATIRPDGSFSVGTNSETDGIAPGQYKVSLIVTGEEAPSGDDYKPAESLIDEKYTDPEQSGLTFDTATSPHPFNFSVDRKK